MQFVYMCEIRKYMKYVYTYIVIDRQIVSFYQNSSVWLKT